MQARRSAFGGVEIKLEVATIDAEYAMPNMIAVAVLDTHMVMNPVAIMNPRTIILGLVPTTLTTFNAMRR